MKRVYKYVLKPQEFQVISIPSEQLLSIESQREDIVVYALVDLENQTINDYEIAVYGTGHAIGIPIDQFTFLGTVKMDNGDLMFHAFYHRK